MFNNEFSLFAADCGFVPKACVAYRPETKGKCKANKKENNLENVIATISCLLNRSDTCNVEIQYCHNCKRYFVDEQSLAEYEKRYGLLLFERMKSSDDSGWFEGSDYSFDSDTILSRYGYSAQTDIQRKTKK